MFAGGLFAEDNQLEEAVEAALEIREEVRRYSDDLRSRTGHDWALRIGIHTGLAITGIIGTWRFIYDVWGPTVNIASRLEAASLPHKINVSQQVYDSLRRTNRYTLEPRGALAIKNMQAVEMCFVRERKRRRSGRLPEPVAWLAARGEVPLPNAPRRQLLFLPKNFRLECRINRYNSHTSGQNPQIGQCAIPGGSLRAGQFALPTPGIEPGAFRQAAA